MNTLRQYQKRFNQLMESKSGDVKPLIMEQPTEDTTNQLTPEQEAFLDIVTNNESKDPTKRTWSTPYGDNTIKVNGDVNITSSSADGLGPSFKDRVINLKFSYVTGYFYCTDQFLESLEGAPLKVDGDFDCSRNNLRSLKGGPTIVGGNFDCSDNPLCFNSETGNLEGIPSSIGGDFIATNSYRKNITDRNEGIKKGDKWYKDLSPVDINYNVPFTEEDVRKVCKVGGKVII